MSDTGIATAEEVDQWRRSLEAPNRAAFRRILNRLSLAEKERDALKDEVRIGALETARRTDRINDVEAERDALKARLGLDPARPEAVTQGDRELVNEIRHGYGGTDQYPFRFLVFDSDAAKLIAAHRASAVAPYREVLTQLVKGVEDMGPQASAFLIVMADKARTLLATSTAGDNTRTSRDKEVGSDACH